MHYDLVIVGGGAGGLELAARLGRYYGRSGLERVLLIDRSIIHIWKPTLHEVAVGTLNIHQEGLSYNILSRNNHFSFMLGNLIGFDPVARNLTLGPEYDREGTLVIPERTVGFSDCVLATGSGSNFFDTPGAEHAWVLENSDDARHFHKHLLSLFARTAYGERTALQVCIVGGGATGVELSAELVEAYHEVLQSFGSGQRFRLEVTLIEAGERILAALSEEISAQAAETLRLKHIQILTQTRVIRIEKNSVHTEHNGISKEIPCDVVVWAAGIKAAQRNTGFGLEINRLNQFIVDGQLKTSMPHVYALGDCAQCTWAEGKIVPARAQSAHQQAGFLYRLFKAQDREKHFTDTFKYTDFGSLVSLGNKQGVGQLMSRAMRNNLFIEGLIAKYMYMSLHLMHHKAILGTRKTLLLALARMVQKRISGRLKLH